MATIAGVSAIVPEQEHVLRRNTCGSEIFGRVKLVEDLVVVTAKYFLSNGHCSALRVLVLTLQELARNWAAVHEELGFTDGDSVSRKTDDALDVNLGRLTGCVTRGFDTANHTVFDFTNYPKRYDYAAFKMLFPADGDAISDL